MKSRLCCPVVLLALWAGAVQAEDWVLLDGPSIRATLTARVLGYPDGRVQDFKADGTTILGTASGRWTVEGDRVCTKFAHGEPWVCADVARGGRGLDIRFTDEAGHVTVGRYVDLR